PSFRPLGFMGQFDLDVAYLRAGRQVSGLLVKLSEYRIMHLQICAFEIVHLQLSAEGQRNLATVALPGRQLAVQFANLGKQKADEPTASLLSILTQAVELLL